MAVKTHNWITLWFILTTPVILWDVGYCFMRAVIFTGYGNLMNCIRKLITWADPSNDIDAFSTIIGHQVYGLPSLESGDGFTNAQSLLNVIETMMNLAYVYLALVLQWPGAPIVGFGSALMTLSKTVLYWAQEYYCGFCAIGHNNFFDLFFLWIIPNGAWIVVPTFIVWQLGKDLVESLTFAEAQSKKIASGKKS